MYNELKAGILLIQPTCQSMNCYPFSLAIPGLAAEIADINPILLSIVNSSFCDQRLLLEYQTDNQIHNNQLSVLNSQSDWAKPFLPVLKELVISWVDKSVEKNNNPMTPFQSALNNLFCLWASKKVKRCDYRQLLTVQTSTLELIRTEIETESRILQQHGTRIFSLQHLSHLCELKTAIDKEIRRETNTTFTIAACGMVKAGKSLLLNALMGSSILPSGDLPSTAWPCRIRHVHGQSAPHLQIDRAVYQPSLNAICSRQYGTIMTSYNPKSVQAENSIESDDQERGPGIDYLESDMSENGPTLTEHTKKIIYNDWVDLSPSTKENLLCFESPDFSLSEEASGLEDVKTLLAQINDIVRLCLRFNIDPLPRLGKWPILTINFTSLQDVNSAESLEFIDLPGLGEANKEAVFFRELLDRVCNESNAILPIVSYKEAAREDWRSCLFDVLMDSIGHAPDLVICTHRDQISNEGEYNSSVSKVFWKSDPSQARVLGCSTPLGFSAITLIQQSEKEKPEYRDSWFDTGSTEYACIREILGKARARARPIYEAISYDDWKSELHDQLERSGFERIVQAVSRDLVKNAPPRALALASLALEKKFMELENSQSSFLHHCRHSDNEVVEMLSRIADARRGLEDELNDSESTTHASNQKFSFIEEAATSIATINQSQKISSALIASMVTSHINTFASRLALQRLREYSEELLK